MAAATKSVYNAFAVVPDVSEATTHNVPAPDAATLTLEVKQTEDDHKDHKGADGKSDCENCAVKAVFWGRMGLRAFFPQLDHRAVCDLDSFSRARVVFSDVECQIVVGFSVKPVFFCSEAHKTQGIGHLRRDEWGFSLCVIDKREPDHDGRVDGEGVGVPCY